MSVPGIALEACLIVDNNVLSMLSHYFCERKLAQIPGNARLNAYKGWMRDQVSLLQQFTPDKVVHCTDCVAQEFAPSGTFFAQLKPHEHQGLKNYVKSLVNQHVANMQDVHYLRGLSGAPKKLVGAGGVSDNDLSLVVRGLEMTSVGQRIYILSNEEDLRNFITWIRTNQQVNQRWPGVKNIEGLHSLTYFESIHRHCAMKTEEMEDLLHFVMFDHYNRVQLAGTQKGNSLVTQMLAVMRNLRESAEIKHATKEAAL